MIPEDLTELIEGHAKWLRKEDGGKRACLAGAELSGVSLPAVMLHQADLRGAHLEGANLVNAELSESALSYANLSEANLYRAMVFICGSRHNLQYNKSIGELRIGCHVYHLEYWILMYDVIGREEGYTDEQIAEYRNYMRMLKNYL